jgi:hypothetical protein
MSDRVLRAVLTLSVCLAGVAACSSSTKATSGSTASSSAPTTATTAAPTTAAPSTTAASSGLTLAAYNMLTNGMTEAEVMAITGPCEPTSETNIAGHTSKSWNCNGASPFSAATLIFSDGKLSSKAQFGLADTSTETKGSMTTDKFNQLQTGQSTAEVQAITGPCDKTSETNIAGHTSVSYTCHASDGIGSAILIFSDDKLASKSQFGLP